MLDRVSRPVQSGLFCALAIVLSGALAVPVRAEFLLPINSYKRPDGITSRSLFVDPDTIETVGAARPQVNQYGPSCIDPFKPIQGSDAADTMRYISAQIISMGAALDATDRETLYEFFEFRTGEITEFARALFAANRGWFPDDRTEPIWFDDDGRLFNEYRSDDIMGAIDRVEDIPTYVALLGGLQAWNQFCYDEKEAALREPGSLRELSWFRSDCAERACSLRRCERLLSIDDPINYRFYHIKEEILDTSSGICRYSFKSEELKRRRAEQIRREEQLPLIKYNDADYPEVFR